MVIEEFLNDAGHVTAGANTDATIEFFLDSSGAVTHFILSAAEGDARYDRKP